MIFILYHNFIYIHRIITYNFKWVNSWFCIKNITKYYILSITSSILSLLIIFTLNGSPLIAIVLITALGGAISGFLPYNFNPAKTFIGDTGSNFLGFSLAVISILGVAKTYTALVLIAPIMHYLFLILCLQYLEE